MNYLLKQKLKKIYTIYLSFSLNIYAYSRRTFNLEQIVKDK